MEKAILSQYIPFLITSQYTLRMNQT